MNSTSVRAGLRCHEMGMRGECERDVMRGERERERERERCDVMRKCERDVMQGVRE